MIMIKNLTPVIKYEKLKIKNAYNEILTATVSHDMRTPLNSIIGLNHFEYWSILNTLESFVEGEGKNFLNIIKSSSKFLLFLVNDLLDFLQIKNGKFKKNLQWVNIDKTLKELLAMFELGVKEKGMWRPKWNFDSGW